jgi:large subunit ribosomal protein L4
METRVIHPQLREDIFAVKVLPHLLQQVVRMQLNNRRAGSAATKTKGLVRGGGKKPWRQKGTGRARAGSIRSPLWVGGGTIFGPQPRDYTYRLPKKARRSALLSTLSLKNREGKLIVVEKIELSETKTKLMRQMLADLKVESALIVLGESARDIELATRNLPNAKVLRVDGLNVYDILRHEHLILTAQALQAIEAKLAA